MEILFQILVAVVALEHLYIMYFEMFSWETIGKKTFNTFPKHLFEPTKSMAANQGLYNGFLAAGLIWTFFITNMEWKLNIALFFLICIAIAGIYGAITVSRKIFFVQAFPALLAIISVLILKFL